jgi:hypothetical protein
VATTFYEYAVEVVDVRHGSVRFVDWRSPRDLLESWLAARSRLERDVHDFEAATAAHEAKVEVRVNARARAGDTLGGDAEAEQVAAVDAEEWPRVPPLQADHVLFFSGDADGRSSGFLLAKNAAAVRCLGKVSA